MRASLRLAWRELVAHKGRSALVLFLIGLPIALSLVVASLLTTVSTDSDESRPYTVASAQALVSAYPEYDDDGNPVGEFTRERATAALEAATDLPYVDVTWQEGWIASAKAGQRINSLQADFDNVLTYDIARVFDGRMPTGPGEILVSSLLAKQGFEIGTEVRVNGAEATVVGVGRSMRWGSITEDGVLISSGTKTTLPIDPNYHGEGFHFLVGDASTGPLPEADLERLTESPTFQIERTADSNWMVDDMYLSDEDAQLLALLIVCLLIEITLLAGPAIAVGVRRQRQALALLVVAGGTPADVRRVVLIQGFILGLAASVIAALASYPIAWAGVAITRAGWGYDLGDFEFGTIAVLPAIILGTVSALIAALIPALNAAKNSVGPALAGRQPAPKVIAGWPIAGAVVLALGFVGSLSTASSYGDDFANAWWAVVAVIGAIMLIPWLLSAIASLVSRFPLPIRLAVRDANRHRARSTPAVAAVMASVAALTAIGIAASTDAKQVSESAWTSAPTRSVVVTGPAVSAQEVLTKLERATGYEFAHVFDLSDTYVDAGWGRGTSTEVSIATPEHLRAWGVELTEAQARALESGTPLVDTAISAKFDDGIDPKAPVDVPIEAWSGDEDKPSTLGEGALPVDLAMRGSTPEDRFPVAGLVVSSAHAAAHRMPDSTPPTLRALAPVSADELNVTQVRNTVGLIEPLRGQVEVVEADGSDYWLIMLALSLAGAAAVLLGTLSATGLTLNDARPDLATLGSIGASPASRRIICATHAALIAFLGGLLGMVVGLVPGISASSILSSGSLRDFSVPWPLFGLILVGLPVLSALITAAVVRPAKIKAERAV